MSPDRTRPRRLAPAFDRLEGRRLLSATPPASAASTGSVAADFDGDGRDDLASVDVAANAVDIRLSRGDGTFGAPASIGLGTPPRNVVAGDFDGDGRPDLAVTTPGGADVLLNRGDGTFHPPVALVDGRDVGPIVVRAFNGISVPAGSDFVPIVAGDFDGDGRLDLALKGYDDPPDDIRGVHYQPARELIEIAFGGGDGTFHAPAGPPIREPIPGDALPRAGSIGMGGLVAGDFGGDGRDSLVEAIEPDSYGVFDAVNVLTLGADGTFRAAPPVRTLGTVYSLAAGDLDGDGKADLVFSKGKEGAEVFRGLKSGTLGPVTAVDFKLSVTNDLSPQSIALGDFDADGSLDLLTIDANQAAIGRNRGDGTIAGVTAYVVGGAVDLPIPESTGSTLGRSLAVGDFDGNGAPDFALVSDRGDVLAVLGGGDGAFPLPRSNPVPLPVADPDPALPRPIVGAFFQPIVGALAGDFLGHGVADLALVVHTGEGAGGDEVAVIERRADGTYGPAVVTTLPPLASEDPPSLAAADLDGDGLLDLVAVGIDLGSAGPGPPGGLVQAFLNRGDGSFAPGPKFAVGRDVFHLALDDLDGDGRPDLVLTDSLAGTVLVAIGRGGAFGPVTTYALGSGRFVDFPAPEEIGVGDVDGDGRLDLVIAERPRYYSSAPGTPSYQRFSRFTASGVSVLLGDGDGTFGPPKFFNDSYSLSGLLVADFDGDGRADIAFNPGGIPFSGGYLSSDPGPAPSGAVSRLPESGGVTVLQGRADGTFGASSGTPLELGRAVLAVADLDGDGRPDLIAAGDGRSPAKRINRGDGTFGPLTPFSADDARFGIPGLAGYFDGDGRNELVVPGPGGGIAVFALPSAASVRVRNARVVATVGVPVPAQVLAGVTIAGLDASTAFAASVDWGDGTTSAASVVLRSFTPGDGVSPPAATLDVVAGHAFARAGSLAVRVTLTRPDGSKIHVLSLADVAPAPVTLSADAPGRSDGAEGVELAFPIGFASTDPSAAAGDFSASIDWGDGTPATSGVVSAPAGGGFRATGSHAYLRPGTYPIRATIRDRAGHAASASGLAAVAWLDLVPGGAALSLGEGEAAVGAEVAEFSGPTGGPLAPGFLSAAIDWGDGTFSAGSIEGPEGGGPIRVRGGHRYGAPGTFAVAVTLALADGRSVVAHGSATVSAPAPPPPPPAQPPPASPTFRGSVAVGDSTERQGPAGLSAEFATGGAIAPASGVSAAIDWGDGTIEAGAVSLATGATGPVVRVGGGHAYAESGEYAVRVWLVDPSGRVVGAEGRASVADVPIALAGRLDPGSDSGASASDGITNDPTPTFAGTSEPGSTVRVFAVRAGAPAVLELGRATADAAGRWSVASSSLVDGIYTVAAEAADPAGVTRAAAPLSTTAWGDTMVVDTVAPRLVALASDPASGRFVLAFADESGLDPATLLDPSRYLVVAARPPGGVLEAVDVEGSAGSPAVALAVRGGLAPGLYALGLASGGVADAAGNATTGLLALDDLPGPEIRAASAVPVVPLARASDLPQPPMPAIAPSQRIPKVMGPNGLSGKARDPVARARRPIPTVATKAP